MPKIVEIIGPSGSGKSSVYNELKERWEYGFNWVPYDQVQYSPEARFGSMMKRVQRVLKEIIPRKKPDVPKHGVNKEWKFVARNNDYFLGKEQEEFKSVLMDLIEEHCRSDYGGFDKRFITAYMFMWSMGRIDTVKSIKNDDRFCILDQGEGLISRIMHLTSPSFDEDALNLYLENVPAPDILFYLDTDLQTIFDRIQKRDRNASLHEGMNDSEIHAYTSKVNDFLGKAADILGKKGVGVHKVNSSKSIDQVVTQIDEILSSK